jgi:glycosyltransferase involved in cell wall biosynthesis
MPSAGTGGNPLVSVCIPTYNNAAMLGDALRSATAQAYPALDIVVVDNHSQDATREVVEAARRADTRIRYLRNEQNIGMARNLSACVEAARGEFVKLLADDDLLHPQCVARLVEAFGWGGDVVLAGCARRFVDAGLQPLRTAGWRGRRGVFRGADVARECFAWGNRIGEPSAVMFRRAAAARGFDARYSQVVDLEMWSELLREGSFAFTPEVLCDIRLHAGQITRRNMRDGRIVEERRQYYRDMAPRLAPSLSLLQRWAWDGRMALCLTRYGDEAARRAQITELFFPRAFRSFTLPLVSAGAALYRL